MEILVGTVTQNEDLSKSGEILATFPKVDNNRAQPVVYTSPYCKANAGGFIAIPNVGDQILAAYNPDSNEKEAQFYYLSTILKSDLGFPPEDGLESPFFNLMKSNDPKAQIYGKRNRPVTQTFTNDAGAGLYIQREFNTDSISNNVTIKSEGGEEVNVGPVGVHIRNADGDGIVLNGAEPNDAYGARSLAIETQSSQEYKCVNSDITMRVLDGGDINIENNSMGFHAIPPFYGNVRLKSQHKDVTIAALGPLPGVPIGGNIHIVTKTGKIKINGLTGEVEIFTPTVLSLKSLGSISVNAGADLSLNAGGIVSVNSGGLTNITGGLGVNIGSTGNIDQSGGSVSVNGEPLVTINPVVGSNPTAATPAGARPVVPIAVPNILPPLPNEYLDGVDPTGAGGAI